MTDKTCSTCIWYDKYFNQEYGFCREKQMWVDGDKNCEVHSGREQRQETHGHCSGAEA